MGKAWLQGVCEAKAARVQQAAEQAAEGTAAAMERAKKRFQS